MPSKLLSLSLFAAAFLTGSTVLVLAQGSGSSGGSTGGASSGSTGGGSPGTAGTGAPSGTGPAPGMTPGQSSTIPSNAGTPGTGASDSRIPSGTGPVPAPTAGQSTGIPSNAGTPGTGGVDGNRIPNNAEAAPAPTPGQSSGIPSGIDSTGITRNTPQAGCGSAGSTVGGTAMPADTGTPRIIVDPALGSGRNVQSGGAGTMSSTLPNSTRC